MSNEQGTKTIIVNPLAVIRDQLTLWAQYHHEHKLTGEAMDRLGEIINLLDGLVPAIDFDHFAHIYSLAEMGFFGKTWHDTDRITTMGDALKSIQEYCEEHMNKMRFQVPKNG